MAEKNVFWQNSGRQFPYPKSINGNPYNWLVQIQSFARDHYTIASANHEPQDWRPSLNVLHQRVADSCTIAALLDCLVLYNGDGAGDSIPQWFHLQALRPPDDGLLPVQQAIGLMPAQLPPQSPVMRISEPLWPLPAFRVVGTAEVIAGEVTKLARRCSEIAGERATESIAIYVRDGVLTCIYVPRDRTREYVEEFGGKLGAFEVAAGAFVFSDPDRCAALRGGQIAFTDLWAMLRRVRPEWADEL